MSTKIEDALKPLKERLERAELEAHAAREVCRVSVDQLNQWQALANALLPYARHREGCRSEGRAFCDCGLAELRNHPLLK